MPPTRFCIALPKNKCRRQSPAPLSTLRRGKCRMKKPNGIFITGTDTGVGKTIISAAVLSILKSAGVDAVYMKPVQTGCGRKSGRLIAPDLEFVLSMSGIRPSVKERQLMAPYRFRRACSPHLAAGLEKRPILPGKIINSFNALKRLHDFVIVEGAGGVLTPLSWKHSILEVMKSLSLPVILVAKPGLGTINHTLLSLRELRHSNLKVLGVVFNYSSGKGEEIIERSNKIAIERLGRVRVIAEFPFIAGLRHDAHARKKFKNRA